MILQQLQPHHNSLMTMSSNDAVLLPFHQIRASRHAYLARTRSLLSALEADDDDITLLSLATVDTSSSTTSEDEVERRSTCTYIVRRLSDKERATLIDPRRCNCRVTHEKNWHSIKIMYRVAGNGEGHTMSNWDMSSALMAQVRNNCFGQQVILGVVLDGPDSFQEAIPSKLCTLAGVTDNGLIQNAILEPGCSLHKNVQVSNTHAMKYAAIIGCGTVSCTEAHITKGKKECNFDIVNGSLDIEVGPEAGGGRVVNAKIESTLVDVCHQLNMDSNSRIMIAPLLSFNDGEEQPTMIMRSPLFMNILCPHSSIIHTPRTCHVHLLPHSSIDSAASVTSAILFPFAIIKEGSSVSYALLQWNATITSQSDARRVYLMERAEVGPHSFTANAIYGPDSHVSGGEVHCTLFGPNANSHHQSLLIGIIWPLGRGNVGYGSNVGSNHTGRIPDQETSVGEGTFWGLGCVIKFPVDLTSAPYSIIAAGVQLPPQRITLPFSLITDGPGGMNQLTPGWLLEYSPYTIARSEMKFANRRTAKRHDFYTGWKILRPGIIDLLFHARNSLVVAGQQHQSVAGEGTSSQNRVYKTDRAIPGLGANQLNEKGRQIGIKAYTDAIQRYALRGLLMKMVAFVEERKGIVSVIEAHMHVGLDNNIVHNNVLKMTPPESAVDWPILPWNEPSHTDNEALWGHQQAMLLNELPSMIVSGTNSHNILLELLQKCIALEDDHANRVYKSKSRDDERGAATVPGYRDAHIPAEKDSVVLMARDEANRVRKDVQSVQEALSLMSNARSRL